MNYKNIQPWRIYNPINFQAENSIYHQATQKDIKYIRQATSDFLPLELIQNMLHREINEL